MLSIDDEWTTFLVRYSRLILPLSPLTVALTDCTWQRLDEGRWFAWRVLALEKQTLKWMQLTAFLNKNNFQKPSPNTQENWPDHQEIVT